jgi:hypothetical protein
MLAPVGADDLYLHRPYCGTLGDAAPSVARDVQRIDGVADDRATKAKIVLSHGVSDAIAFVVDWNGLITISDSALYRVDAQIDCTELPSELAGEGALPRTREATEYDEHASSTLLSCFDPYWSL